MIPAALFANVFPFIEHIPPFALILGFVIVFLLTTAVKAFALWHAARNKQVFWFVALLVLNTLGILELVYLLAFRKDKQSYASPEPDVAPSPVTA